MAVVVIYPNTVQDQGSGEHCSAVVRCALQALLETTTLQAPAAGGLGQLQSVVEETLHAEVLLNMDSRKYI